MRLRGLAFAVVFLARGGRLASPSRDRRGACLYAGSGGRVS